MNTACYSGGYRNWHPPPLHNFHKFCSPDDARSSEHTYAKRHRPTIDLPLTTTHLLYHEPQKISLFHLLLSILFREGIITGLMDCTAQSNDVTFGDGQTDDCCCFCLLPLCVLLIEVTHIGLSTPLHPPIASKCPISINQNSFPRMALLFYQTIIPSMPIHSLYEPYYSSRGNVV